MKQELRVEDVSRILSIVQQAWEQAPFNRLLGFRIDYVNPTEGRISFLAKPELIGNFHQGILHGGVISTALDTAGGLVACISALAHMRDLSLD